MTLLVVRQRLCKPGTCRTRSVYRLTTREVSISLLLSCCSLGNATRRRRRNSKDTLHQPVHTSIRSGQKGLKVVCFPIHMASISCFKASSQPMSILTKLFSCILGCQAWRSLRCNTVKGQSRAAWSTSAEQLPPSLRIVSLLQQSNRLIRKSNSDPISIPVKTSSCKGRFSLHMGTVSVGFSADN